MKRNFYALALLLLIACALYGCGNYVKRSTDGLQQQVRTAYLCATKGDYHTAALAYTAAAEYCKAQSRFLGLLVRRSALDKANETLATLCYYATPDNQQDLGVETARACRQLEQLASSFFGGF